MLKNCYRQYEQYSKLRIMLKTNLISLFDQTFPEVNRLFTIPRRADVRNGRILLRLAFSTAYAA